jgi:hypothetical protein
MGDQLLTRALDGGGARGGKASAAVPRSLPARQCGTVASDQE